MIENNHISLNKWRSIKPIVECPQQVAYDLKRVFKGLSSKQGTKHDSRLDLQCINEIFCHHVVAALSRSILVHSYSATSCLFSVMSPVQRVKPRWPEFPYIYWVASPSPRKREIEIGGRASDIEKERENRRRDLQPLWSFSLVPVSGFSPLGQKAFMCGSGGGL